MSAMRWLALYYATAQDEPRLRSISRLHKREG
jgi:hypothetical protein